MSGRKQRGAPASKQKLVPAPKPDMENQLLAPIPREMVESGRRAKDFTPVREKLLDDMRTSGEDSMSALADSIYRAAVEAQRGDPAPLNLYRDVLSQLPDSKRMALLSQAAQVTDKPMVDVFEAYDLPATGNELPDTTVEGTVEPNWVDEIESADPGIQGVNQEMLSSAGRHLARSVATDAEAYRPVWERMSPEQREQMLSGLSPQEADAVRSAYQPAEMGTQVFDGVDGVDEERMGALMRARELYSIYERGVLTANANGQPDWEQSPAARNIRGQIERLLFENDLFDAAMASDVGDSPAPPPGSQLRRQTRGDFPVDERISTWGGAEAKKNYAEERSLMDRPVDVENPRQVDGALKQLVGDQLKQLNDFHRMQLREMIQGGQGGRMDEALRASGVNDEQIAGMSVHQKAAAVMKLHPDGRGLANPKFPPLYASRSNYEDRVFDEDTGRTKRVPVPGYMTAGTTVSKNNDYRLNSQATSQRDREIQGWLRASGQGTGELSNLTKDPLTGETAMLGEGGLESSPVTPQNMDRKFGLIRAMVETPTADGGKTLAPIPRDKVAGLIANRLNHEDPNFKNIIDHAVQASIDDTLQYPAEPGTAGAKYEGKVLKPSGDGVRYLREQARLGLGMAPTLQGGLPSPHRNTTDLVSSIQGTPEGLDGPTPTGEAGNWVDEIDAADGGDVGDVLPQAPQQTGGWADEIQDVEGDLLDDTTMNMGRRQELLRALLS